MLPLITQPSADRPPPAAMPRPLKYALTRQKVGANTARDDSGDPW
jgi:hypothetical protein